jgi:hypothetical protein
MAKKAKEAVLNELHALTAKHLIARIKSGEASAQEINAAIKFLKDNGIEAEKEPGSDMDKLSQVLDLPTFDDEEIED